MGFVDYGSGNESANESDIIGIENFGVTLTVTKKKDTKKDTENIVLDGFKNTKLNGEYKKKTKTKGKPYYKKKETETEKKYYIFFSNIIGSKTLIISTDSPNNIPDYKNTCAFIYSESEIESFNDIKKPQWIECFEQKLNKGKNLQWNDMTNVGGSLTTISGRGNLIPKIYIQKYLQDFNINSIISGHQDTINIGCIFNDNPDEQWDEWIEKKEKEEEEKNQIKFHIPKGYKDLKNSTIEINTKELVALVTSTAVYSKYSKKKLNKNCYLELK